MGMGTRLKHNERHCSSNEQCHETSSPKGNDRSPENKQVFLNSSLVSKRFFSIGQGQPTLQSMVDPILNSIKGCYSVANLQKKNDTLKSQRRSCQ